MAATSSIYLGFLALFGIFAFKTTHPYFLVAYVYMCVIVCTIICISFLQSLTLFSLSTCDPCSYAALVFYNFNSFGGVYYAIQGDCLGTYGDEGYCGLKWQTYLSFMFLGYQYAAICKLNCLVC